jgi:hypothetical protein
LSVSGTDLKKDAGTKKTLRSLMSQKLKVPSALSIKGKGSLRGFDETELASVETEVNKIILLSLKFRHLHGSEKS